MTGTSSSPFSAARRKMPTVPVIRIPSDIASLRPAASSKEDKVCVDLTRQGERRSFPGAKVRRNCTQSVRPRIPQLQPVGRIGKELAHCRRRGGSRQFFEYRRRYPRLTENRRQEILLPKDYQIPKWTAVGDDNHRDQRKPSSVRAARSWARSASA
jgi:hypothetical protein